MDFVHIQTKILKEPANSNEDRFLTLFFYLTNNTLLLYKFNTMFFSNLLVCIFLCHFLHIPM